MSNPENLEQRVTRLEQRVDREAVLRAVVDEDLSDVTDRLRNQKRMLQALRETQIEHTVKLDQHTAKLNQLNGEIATIRRDHGEKLDVISAKLDRLLDAGK